MKRKTKPSIFETLRHRFPPTSLYRTDIENIIEMANDRELDVKISDKDYEYYSLDEVQEQRGNRVDNLNIVMDKDNSIYKTLDLLIEKDGITVRCQKEDHLVPLWHEIKEVISKRVPWYARLMSPLSGAWAIVVWLWLGPSAGEFNALPWAFAFAWLGLLGVFSFATIFSINYRLKNRGIYLQKRHEVRDFWERNGDRILMLFLGTALGIVGTVIADVITGT